MDIVWYYGVGGCPNGRTDPECPIHVDSPTPCLIILVTFNPMDIVWYYGIGGSSWQVCGWGYGGLFCIVLDSLSTKWFWERFSSLQNGMATNLDPTKWCSLSTILDLFYPQRFWYFHPKMVKYLDSCSKKNPEPFCRASSLSGTQLQGQLFHSRFVGFLPCQWRIFNIYKKPDLPWKPSTKLLFVPYRMVRFGAQKISMFLSKNCKTCSNPLFTTK